MSVKAESYSSTSTLAFSARRIRAHLNADPEQPIACFRETLAWGTERLYSVFSDGAPTDSLVKARSYLVDEVLCAAWDRFLPAGSEGFALIAVGGYGRSELLPYSDIDLLLLNAPESMDVYKAKLERFFAFLWDIGLEVGSSVRTVDQCAQLAAADLTVITNLLEARMLCGDQSIYASLLEALTPDRMWPSPVFYRAKLEEQKVRHHKFDDTGYKLEPNVKESPGGLRDIHTVAWIAKRHFGVRTLGELRERGFLTKAECDELFAGQDFLWRVRFALHMLTGRHEDRLLFDHQVRIAELFGYIDSDHNRAVEQFMQLYYRTIKSLSCLNDILLQLFDEAILQQTVEQPVTTLNNRFRLRGNVIEVTSEEVFAREPRLLLEIFSIMQKMPEIKGIRAQTLRLMRRSLPLIKYAVRDDFRSRRLFIGMFQHGDGLTRALRRMNRYGVLGQYLPEFGRIVGHMQYDLFHTLTVDEHSLQVVRNLRRMAMPRFRDELPFASAIFNRIPKPELIYIAALMHDLAKGRGGDHSDLGARDAHQFCLNHGLSNADSDLISWLVSRHLLMSLTAQRQDISSPEIIADFARKIQERTRLDYLYLLTVADIRATNPNLWNSWRDSLLRTLYESTADALERGLDNPLCESERVAERQRQAAAIMSVMGCNLEDSLRITLWKRFDNDYFLRHTPRELAWHLSAISAAQDKDLPLILVDFLKGQGVTVFVYTRDRDHLFALTAGVLARLGLSILDARINTTADGYTTDSWIIMESDDTQPQPGRRYVEIATELRKTLSDLKQNAVSVNRRLSPRLRHFITPTSIHFRQDSDRNCTVMELVTGDRPALLALIGRVFDKRGIRVDAAKIGTIGERAEDVFFITDARHNPIRDEKLLDRLAATLSRALDYGQIAVNRTGRT